VGFISLEENLNKITNGGTLYNGMGHFNNVREIFRNKREGKLQWKKSQQRGKGRGYKERKESRQIKKKSTKEREI
jgi:hypothetical protein